MKVRFYGTRGSCPTPGPSTVKYGGNTACVLLTANNGNKLILDAGTGIRLLGNELIHQQSDVHLLVTHNHYDHIQGFPFFKPIYQAGRYIHIYPAITEPNNPYAIVEQMQGSYSPIETEMLVAELEFQFPDWARQPVMINGFRVYRQKMNHPNAGMAYLIECDNKRVAYVTDNELHAPNAATSESDWQSFVSQVDLLIHDGQYIEADFPHKLGWGHSLISESINLAELAQVKQLAIYSHDPQRTDSELDNWQQKIDAMALTVNAFISFEGQELEL